MKFENPMYSCVIAFILVGLASPCFAYETLETSLDDDEPKAEESSKKASKIKEETKKKEDSSSNKLESNGYTFNDGPLLEKRKSLHKRILEAKSVGVGVRPYMVHLSLIEDRVKRGESEEAILKHVNKVEDGLSKQGSTAPLLPKGEKPISKYMVKLEKLVKEKINIAGLDNRCKMTFQIDSKGKIFNVKPDKENKASTASQNKVNAALMTLSPFDPPPKPNMPIYFGIGKTGKDPLIAYKGKVDYRPYMEYIQWKIKKNWHPPKSNFTKKLTVYYTVKRSGEVCKIRLEKPSGYADCDEAAINALKTSNPFPELPDGSYPSVDISFDFDYNVWKKGRLINKPPRRY